MKTFYEEVFFYLDLTKDIIKKKELIKAIKFFISEKNKSNLKGHYGLLIFQEEGNPIFIIEKKDANIIANAIEENWKTRPRKKSYFENGLFYIFSYIAETVRKKSKVNRIIIITDTPSDLSEDYTEALFNLISKIKNFPTFIDIVRISQKSERFFKDDVKLNILASDTNGSIFYIHEKKSFFNVIGDLIKSKQIRAGEQEKLKIKKEDYKFYSQLAKNLVFPSEDLTETKCYLCQEDICPLCTDIYDVPKSCESCGSIFHNCCITNYTIQNNIGIPHIFRCPRCDILLKIEQDEIVELIDDKTKSVEDYIESEFTELKPEDSASHITPKRVKVGSFFGKFYSIKKEEDKLIYQKIRQEPQTDMITNNFKKDKSGSFINCPECGTHVERNKGNGKRCPYCGHKF
ncbi:MAG: hypothetical protein ACFFFB_08945 [Candidatus Heimdallarchaeota archaeon]